MTSAQLLTDAFGRIREVVHEVVEGLTPEQLAYRIDEDANSIAWLVWHLTRIQDDHMADVMGTEQVWTADGWADRFALPFDASDTGYGHTSDEVAAVKVSSGDLLTGYYDAVHAKSVAYLASVRDDDLTRIVDQGWDPPVTLGVRLISVISDDLQHAGQAAIIKGIL
ncbi:DUF664 domain-containing protein [Actinocrispum sp. NPDC049592]|uniref:mycothiol transferase n=1 Tax=Actinocrispum sp. NPDC049592 TaxID=3154835 RepID=UPI003431AAC5